VKVKKLEDPTKTVFARQEEEARMLGDIWSAQRPKTVGDSPGEDDPAALNAKAFKNTNTVRVFDIAVACMPRLLSSAATCSEFEY
jgi:hypothetical protein